LQVTVVKGKPGMGRAEHRHQVLGRPWDGDRLMSEEHRPTQRLGRPGDPLPRRVLLFRALQLGDLLCAIPAFRALRAALPDSELVLIGLPWARWLVDRFSHYLSGFREFPGYPGLPERTPDLPRIPPFFSQLQAERFDLAVQMHGSGSYVNSITVLAGARHSAGFFVPGNYCPDPDRFLPWPESGLEIHRLLRLTEFLGAPAQGDRLEFPLRADDHRSLGGIVSAERLRPGRYVCIHPGASVAPRRWPGEHFLAVAQALKRRGFEIVLTGTASERPLTAPIAAAVPDALELAGRTELGPLGALLSGARLLVSNDTGVSHIAAGVRLPSVVISTGDNPGRWAPIDARRHRVLVSEAGVTVDDVLAQVDDLLAALPFDPAERDS